MSTGPDVVVVGEILVEVCGTGSWSAGGGVTLGVSGDALNAAAAAAAAGARTAVLTRIADDELGDLIEQRLDELGVERTLVRRVAGQQGVYFVHSDPDGTREFVYVRAGSAGSTLAPADVAAAGLEEAAVVLTTGITGALSATARAAVLEVAQRAPRLVYDPNLRPRLTTAADAESLLRAVAPRAAVVTPACPGETGPLLGTDDPLTAARIVRGLGAQAAVVTRGPDGVLLLDEAGPRALPAVPAPTLVDQTGAGDSLAGTLAARLALGDDLDEAVALAMSAASLVLGGHGGTGVVPTLEQSREHLAGAGGARVVEA